MKIMIKKRLLLWGLLCLLNNSKVVPQQWLTSKSLNSASIIQVSPPDSMDGSRHHRPQLSPSLPESMHTKKAPRVWFLRLIGLYHSLVPGTPVSGITIFSVQWHLSPNSAPAIVQLVSLVGGLESCARVPRIASAYHTFLKSVGIHSIKH